MYPDSGSGSATIEYVRTLLSLVSPDSGESWNPVEWFRQPPPQTENAETYVPRVGSMYSTNSHRDCGGGVLVSGGMLSGPTRGTTTLCHVNTHMSVCEKYGVTDPSEFMWP